MGMKCKDCIMFDVDHYDMYEEPICSMGNFVIRLKHGQGKPDNCPFRLKKEQVAVKPTWSRGKPFCGACGLRIHGGKFCSECGKPILWEGR